MYQPAVPVADVLEGIHTSEYVLPAIQREFVWKTDQISMLFDSLMRGYPIGAFLFWQVKPENSSQFAFYDFITNFHEKDHPYAPKKPIPAGQGTTAILDGQQRLTALNIGLYGSHSERQPRMWWNNPDAFPKKFLYLNLGSTLGGAEGMAYDFRFLTDPAAKPAEGKPDVWYRVSDILQLKDSGPAMNKEIQRRGLGDTEAFDVLYRLYRSVREDPSITAYIEKSQDPDKVLDIFVRVNSAGSPLSYSDLLLSMATNQWQDLDAREEVRTLVSTFRQLPSSFAFSKDLVLKSGLVLTGVADVGFKISNFTKSNMELMEAKWPEIRATLLHSADLLSSFGYTGRNLGAESVVIPIAYYLHSRGFGGGYASSGNHASDRAKVRDWVTRSLMKRGIWGSGLDTLLRTLRDVIKQHGASGFPLTEIEDAMLAAGKSLDFQDAEVSELLDLEYSDSRTFSVLSVLYPGLDLSKTFHEDHIFPRSLFTKTKLSKAGVAEDLIDDCLAKCNKLANLQLLAGQANIEKQAALPGAWLESNPFQSQEAKSQYVIDNDLQGVPDDLAGFLAFFDARRTALEGRLRQVLGVTPQMAVAP
jgi:hypothetical protein